MNELLIAIILTCLIIIYIFLVIGFSSWPISILLILLLIFFIFKYKNFFEFSPTKFKNNKNSNFTYTKKDFMTSCELEFYYKMIDLSEKYNIVPQINLASIIQKISNNAYKNELFRNIDFAIFTKDYSKLLLLIELNDKTHENDARKKRDKKVREICKIADIKLLTFYTNYPNQKEYIINRIETEIKKISI